MHRHLIHVRRVDNPCTADYDYPDTHNVSYTHLHKLYSIARYYNQHRRTSEELHANSTSSDFPSLLKTSRWSMRIPFLLPTHHEVFVIRLTFCGNEECCGFQCGGGCSYFWDAGDMIGHGSPFYYPRFRIRVH